MLIRLQPAMQLLQLTPKDAFSLISPPFAYLARLSGNLPIAIRNTDT
jgi:hypothetical protein